MSGITAKKGGNGRENLTISGIATVQAMFQIHSVITMYFIQDQGRSKILYGFHLPRKFDYRL
ncbi:hypothetical protein A1342_21970 [Methylomonas methanica]|uniref:Uncharacterized protein n=1 Tax=Methylomonas denitrificans TaxID=1538553 RepID=A0A126T4M6_9GAMM|nr:hypothetical protein JT25_011190 [Methylomonas denitrificans]OAH96245.1 hypothetical protein A1342_21970 [Methylomonas methanica]